MATSIWFKWFKLGRLPQRVRDQMESEQLVMLDEGLSGSITLRNFKAPGRRSSYRKNLFVGSLVLTKQRFAAFAFSKPVVNVALDPVYINKLQLAQEHGSRLVIQFDAADFHDNWSGTVTCVFKTDKAQAFKLALNRAART